MNSTNAIVSWAPDPDGRGTVGLLWGCFATIFLCTWNAVHPNLPAMGERKRDIFLRRLGYVMFCLTGPEIVAAIALSHFNSARNMQKQLHGWSLKKCFLLEMGGFVVQYKHPHNTKRFRVKPEKLVTLVNNKDMEWPELTKEEIMDRSKADWIVKTLALVQILWFTTQMIGRWAQGLATTTLELFTLGIVFSAAITYGAWWEKPFDVQEPVVIYAEESAPLDEADHIDYVQLFLSKNEGKESESMRSRCVGVVICLVFGALHVVAWNFHFPSSTEQLLWRISSIGIVALALPLFVLPEHWRKNSGVETSLSLLLIVYILFRLYMFVEMFVSLRAVEASVYQTPQWSQYFPSFG